jgi:hypothetical protein
VLLTIDASVIAKWFFDEPFQEQAKRLIELPVHFTAPDLLIYEFASIVRKLTRQNKITPNEGTDTIKQFKELSIQYLPAKTLCQQSYIIANELDHHVYDSFYLAIPVMQNGLLVTADKVFYNKVSNSPYQNKICWIENPIEIT